MDVSKKHSAQRDAAGRKGPNSTSSRSANLPRPLMAGVFSVHGPHAFLGSNEATYGLREGGAGFHRNRSAAGKANPHFRQASFAEFEMMMGFDDEALKRYGLPKPMVERALLEAYRTVVLDQQR
jgi:hypothetical protein